jgi:hypothetical protein
MLYMNFNAKKLYIMPPLFKKTCVHPYIIVKAKLNSILILVSKKIKNSILIHK